MIFYATIRSNADESVYVDGITFIKNDGSEILITWDSTDLASDKNVTAFRAKGIAMQKNNEDEIYANGHLQELTKDLKEIRAENAQTADGTPIPEATITKLMIDDNGKEWYWDAEEKTELAFRIADRYVTIQETEDGYDYTVMDLDYKEIDGGVYDNPDVSIHEALNDIIEDLKENPDTNGAKGNISKDDALILTDYDDLMKKVEAANRIE